MSAGSYHKMSSPPSTTAFPYSFHWRIRVRRWLKGMQLQTCYTRINHRLVQLHKLPSTINNIRLQRKKKKATVLMWWDQETDLNDTTYFSVESVSWASWIKGQGRNTCPGWEEVKHLHHLQKFFLKIHHLPPPHTFNFPSTNNWWMRRNKLFKNCFQMS